MHELFTAVFQILLVIVILRLASANLKLVSIIGRIADPLIRYAEAMNDREFRRHIAEMLEQKRREAEELAKKPVASARGKKIKKTRPA